MVYGVLTDEMRAAMAPRVKDHDLWDLGAGDLRLSREMTAMGARVLAIDPRAPDDPAIETIRGTYLDALPRLDITPPRVVLLSWPQTSDAPGLLEILSAVPVVIYLGANTNGSACGTPGLWAHLTTREVLAEVRTEHNDLLIYGAPCGPRPLRPEEQAALSERVLRWYIDGVGSHLRS